MRETRPPQAGPSRRNLMGLSSAGSSSPVGLAASGGSLFTGVGFAARAGTATKKRAKTGRRQRRTTRIGIRGSLVWEKKAGRPPGSLAKGRAGGKREFSRRRRPQEAGVVTASNFRILK